MVKQAQLNYSFIGTEHTINSAEMANSLLATLRLPRWPIDLASRLRGSIILVIERSGEVPMPPRKMNQGKADRRNLPCRQMPQKNDP